MEVLEDPTDLPKFIWLLESREIIPDQYKFIEDNYDYVASKVDGIFTCDQRLTEEVGEDGKFLYCMSNAAPWVMDRDIYTSVNSSQWSHLTKDILKVISVDLEWWRKYYQERMVVMICLVGDFPNEFPLIIRSMQ